MLQGTGVQQFDLKISCSKRVIVICFTSLHKSTFHTLSGISPGFTWSISYLFTKPIQQKHKSYIKSQAEVIEITALTNLYGYKVVFRLKKNCRYQYAFKDEKKRSGFLSWADWFLLLILLKFWAQSKGVSNYIRKDMSFFQKHRPNNIVGGQRTYVRVFFFSLYLILALSLACGELVSRLDSQGDSPARKTGDSPQSW